MVGLSVIIILLAFVGLLVWLAYNFHKYKGKLFAKILTGSGNIKKTEITGKIGKFSIDDCSYVIDRSNIYLDDWLIPKKTLFYKENESKPISCSDSKETDKNINPVELNNLLRVSFSDLFKTQSEGIFSSLSISKRWVFLIIIAFAVFLILVLFGGQLADLIGIAENNGVVYPK